MKLQDFGFLEKANLSTAKRIRRLIYIAVITQI